MKFEFTRYYRKNNCFKQELNFGNLYFCENFFIVEINPEEHIGYSKLKIIFQEITNFYGINSKLVCIANRVNSYSIEPVLFNILEDEFPFLKEIGIVSYNENNHKLATVEQIIIKNKVLRFTSLPEALFWATNYTKDSKSKDMPSFANKTLLNSSSASRRKSS